MNWFRQTNNSHIRHAAQEPPVKQPWEMSKNDYQKHQYTGSISSTAYESYGTSEGLAWLKYERFADLLETVNIKGVPVEIRAETTPNRYVKTDENGDIVRDATGDALYMTDDEVKNQGLAQTSSTIAAFANKTCIGFASDEFGTSGVWVVNDFQKQGLGVRLLEHLHQLNPRLAKNKIGQMTQAGWNMTGAYHKRLVQKALQEGKQVPPEVMQEYPDLATASNKVKIKIADGLFSRDPVQADPKSVGYKEDWGEHHGPVSYVPDTWNFPRGYHQPPMPLPKKVYHVTPFPNEILKEGFKAFRSNTGKQTFGGHGTYVSFTSLENARFYQEGLKDMVRIANGMYSWQDAPSLAKKWGVADEKVPGIVEDVNRWSREGKEPWEDRLKLAHFVKSLSLRGGKFPLFIGVGPELINRLAQVKPEDVAIMEADSSPQEWHTGLGMLSPEEMKGKYTYNEGENEWRVFSPDSIQPQSIRRISNWYGRLLTKTSGFFKQESVTFSIGDTHRISQPKHLLDLCGDFARFIAKNGLANSNFQPGWNDIEPDTSSSGFDSYTGIINFYMRPREEAPNSNPQDYIKAIEAWKADKEQEEYKISYNPTPDTSRMYGVPVIRIKIEQNPSADYPQLPEINLANFNAAATLRLLGLFYPDSYSGCCPAADMLQRINAIEQQQMQEEIRPGGVIPNDPSDPADAWKGEDAEENHNGPTIIDGGLPITRLKGYFVDLRNMCEFAIQNGFKEICWG